MVARLTYLFLLATCFLCSGEFTATVNRNHMNLGESFQLMLTLKEASAKGNPQLTSLHKTFLVHSQQQSSSTTVLNGRSATSTSWKLTLISQGEGEWKIPSISIETSEGVLATDPITISVGKEEAASTNSEPTGLEGVYLTTLISHDKPYKNEPILYTVKLTSQRTLTNLQLQKIELEDAIVEPSGEPKVYDKVERGIRVDVIEFNYLITPLKAGVLKIPATTLLGSLPIARKGQGGFIFDNHFDPISIMQGFDRLEPFSLKTKEAVIDVQPAVAGMNPWLPARSLKIEEVLDESQTLQEGEPFTRSFKIIAEGVKSGQLPKLNDLQMSSPLFKIYADNPQMGDEIKEGRVKSWRKELYTFIPQESGDLTLPEIALTWWDVEKEEKRTTKIPARTLHIKPAIAVTKKAIQPLQESPVVAAAPAKQSLTLYFIIAGLVLLLIAATLFGIALQKKIKRLTEMPKEAPPVFKKPEVIKKKTLKKDKKEKLPDLNPT